MGKRTIWGAAALAGVLVIAEAGDPPGASAPPASPRAIQLAQRCFATGQQRVVGVDRICYYHCGPQSVIAISVPARELCPDFIDR